MLPQFAVRLPQRPVILPGHRLEDLHWAHMKALYVIFISVLLALGLSACSAPRPSDAEIIARFQTNRAQIEKLMGMMRSDRVLTRVDDNWTDPADPEAVGISNERIAEYRSILHAIGFPRGFYYDPKSGRVRFLAWSVGLVTGGAAKSVVYSPSDVPIPLVDDLDTYQPPAGQGYVLAYRRIEGPWYLEIDAQ